MVSSLPLTSPLLEKKGHFVVDDGLGTGLLFAAIFKQKRANYALICPNQYAATKLYEFMLNFLSEDDLSFFPSDELLRAEAMASNRELLSQRLYAMGQLQTNKKKILITHPSALLRFLPNPKRFKEETMEIKVGDTLDLRDFKSRLVDMGYVGVSHIERSLEFASRGDIVDVYSVSYLNPIRVEFFGDEIESIRLFDAKSQQSKESLKSATILPATDLFLNQRELDEFKASIKERAAIDKGILGDGSNELDALVEEIIDLFENHNYKSSLYKYYGFAINEANSILSYFEPDIVFFTNKNQTIEAIDMLQKEASDYFNELFASKRMLSHQREYMELQEAVPNKRKVVYSSPLSTTPGSYEFHAHKIAVNGTNIAAAITTISSYLSTNDKVVIAVREDNQRNTIVGFLNDRHLEYEEVEGLNLPEGKIGLTSMPINEGFELPALRIAYITSNELFGHKTSNSRFTSRFKEATVLRSYEDLKPGDYIVHEYHGIGQFLDVVTRLSNGVHRDYLHVAYANNEFLYIPLEQFRLVRKYAGREGASPKLSSLSGTEWKKRKEKIKGRVNELADRLIALYGSRAKIEGYAFPPDDDFNKQFENGFSHALTPDQQKAVEEIKADMEKPEVMDRLLCGDVGFGKTEVAFRAAFKAINAGKQVALLCPTTLLARQHYEVALQRFGTFGVKIAHLSRLVSESSVKHAFELIENGEIHLVIGTHKILSKKLVFKNLGLLIVDEEQRFGVEQKERIKEISQNIDVLTLSATPIPRTLQMSLVGIRPLSEINTAPENRMPIQTYVTPYKESVVDELISRELSRGGQAFYVYNRVETIYSVAAKLAQRIPGVSIGVVHGQMEKDEIEDVMVKFYENEINVLVCTSIVENGIDIPNANLIIVENADKFGLSQLYQIKGRVGRGDRIAYAYLMYKEYKNMNEDAQKRLEAIQEFTELGSGYKIAQRDLMIRGAGDILGPEQAGFIDSIGLDLYLKLLNEAIEAKKSGKTEAEPPKPVRMFNIDAYIPTDYATKADKLSLYQELDDVKTASDMAEFTKRIRDIYGKIPPEFDSLLKKKGIDILLESEEFKSLEETDKTINVILNDNFAKINGIGSALFNALQKYLVFTKVSFINKRLTLMIYRRDSWIKDVEDVLKATHQTYLKYRI